MTVPVAHQENTFTSKLEQATHELTIYSTATPLQHTHLPYVVGKAAFAHSPLDCTEKQLYTSHPARRVLPGPCATAAGW